MGSSDDVDRCLFVGNLDPRATEEVLFELFLQAGPLVKVWIAKDKDGKLKQFAFVTFKHEESVPYAMSLMNGIRLFGRALKLQYRTGSTHISEEKAELWGTGHKQENTNGAANPSLNRYNGNPANGNALHPSYFYQMPLSNPAQHLQASVSNFNMPQSNRQQHAISYPLQHLQQQQQLPSQAVLAENEARLSTSGGGRAVGVGEQQRRNPSDAWGWQRNQWAQPGPFHYQQQHHQSYQQQQQHPYQQRPPFQQWRGPMY
ncbi:RNA-binding protein 7 [Lethenteron reissneri]|uniref:RNA-binding protein 7 n=1 Tax=Lethenteron reissneri TaxID=7753 RepID=UPI002AB6B79B|nr:RNA-binding protein 7 [Lethenteron reissneri]